MIVHRKQLSIIKILLTVSTTWFVRSRIADMLYTPIQEYDSSGVQLYSEMHTVDWWWDMQISDRCGQVLGVVFAMLPAYSVPW